MHRQISAYLFSCLLLVLTGCASKGILDTPYFSEQHRFPSISFSEYVHTRNEKDLRAKLYVIPDQPGKPYRTKRTLLLRVDAQTDMFSIFFLFDLYQDENLNETFWDQPLYYLSQIDDDGPRSYWSGPYPANHPRVQACLRRDIDLTDAFPEEDLAANIVAFLEDMRFCHGGKHRIYDDSPYVLDWRSISQALIKRRDPEYKQDYPVGSILESEEWVYIWAPVRVAWGDSLGGVNGALSTGLQINDGRVTVLWIDLN